MIFNHFNHLQLDETKQINVVWLYCMLLSLIFSSIYTLTYFQSLLQFDCINNSSQCGNESVAFLILFQHKRDLGYDP